MEIQKNTYKTIRRHKVMPAYELNQFSEDGWELVSFNTIPRLNNENFITSDFQNEDKIIYIFKQTIQTNLIQEFLSKMPGEFIAIRTAMLESARQIGMPEDTIASIDWNSILRSINTPEPYEIIFSQQIEEWKPEE